MNISSIGGMLTTPNVLTASRIAATPLIVVLLMLPSNRVTAFLAALVFSAAAITDYFDGFLARKYGRVSNLGKAMDPLADKFLVSAAFIMLAAAGRVPGWVACIIVIREIGITGLRNVMVGAGQDISASRLGKFKTGFQIAAIIPLLLHYPYFGIDLHLLGTWLLWMAVVLTVWSGADYVIKARPFLQ
ncbi:MAG: CDP-diacylglycerol--glycerol-3-phosphate 3-phosphatidyltransferase [Thermodesulfobacteriota bacterium]|nr:CDP-diacylglycerol--glycerol-3-phosphate 3-phosphatidyltransferase [Thermodesulfobacteriota bacterium]